MPPTIDDREEQQLLSAVKQASDLVAAGKTPDEAIEKIARDSGFGPGKIRLIGQAYNNGQQLGQWRTPSANILDKMASFQLCDPEAVIHNIYKGPTASEKAAAERVSPEYARPPHWATRKQNEKAASYKIPAGPKLEPYKPDPMEAVHKAYGTIQRTKQAADSARREASAAEDNVRKCVANVITYFKQASYNRLPFEVIESAAHSYFGEPAKMLLNMAYASSGLKEKRASDKPPVLKAPINLRAEPFTLLKAAIDAAAKCNQLRKQAEDAKSEATKTKTTALRPFTGAALEAAEEREGKDLDHDGEKGESKAHREKVLGEKAAAAVFGTEKSAFGFGTEVAAIAAGDILAHRATHNNRPEDPYGDVASLDDEISTIQNQVPKKRRVILPEKAAAEKTAIGGATMGAALGGMFGRTMGTMPKTKSDMVDDAWMGLEDPEHENELRKIKAHAMINQLMTDPDDPISGHEPDRVLSAYNEIATATPRVADNIATLRPQLRKRLEGHQEPFETKELLDIEHGLARSKMPTPNTSILGEGPDKLAG